MVETRASGTLESLVQVTAGPVVLDGDLVIPPEALGVVAFAHGSGSSRLSPRNRHVAGRLQAAGLATLLVDLLTDEEGDLDARTRHLRFDIGLLAERMTGVLDWLAGDPRTTDLPIGLFGASTGAAAALVAAARSGERVAAVVSRGGRPDLAGRSLPGARAPTLLIVGGEDDVVIELNRDALARLGSPVKDMVIVAGAGHLFEEPGTLDEVARLAADWFTKYLAPLA
jgi:dienelactone hydrolase